MYGGERLMLTGLDGGRGELISATVIHGKGEKRHPVGCRHKRRICPLSRLWEQRDINFNPRLQVSELTIHAHGGFNFGIIDCGNRLRNPLCNRLAWYAGFGPHFWAAFCSSCDFTADRQISSEQMSRNWRKAVRRATLQQKRAAPG
jgi:hypothetical protein